ncbi:hypothetical protein ACIPI6_31710 [Pseudomonas protegens]|uniref:hypothetical protein n=1 Tax=Pseudomonas protegens TaxID=380021 RepID=UPI00381D12C1
MPKALDGRPLLARLIARTEKYQGCTTAPLATDIILHRQSVEEINRLTAENERLRRFAEQQRQVQDVPLLKNYPPYSGLDTPTQRDLDALVDQLRKNGLSIDGDNAYKRDLCDSIVGALAFGAQNRNPPPPGHWGQEFWEIGREERAITDELVSVAQEALSVINKIKPANHGNGTQVRLAAAIAKATQ